MTQEELAKELGVDQGTISKKLKALEALNAVTTKSRSITVCFLPVFLYDVASKIPKNDYANWQEVYADMHRINAELQEKYDKSHNDRVKKTSLSINPSSKASLSLSPDTEEFGLDDLDAIDRGIQKMIKERENKV